MLVRLPWGPLAEFLPDQIVAVGGTTTTVTTAAQIAGPLRIDRSQSWQWSNRGWVTVDQADRIACALGVHPSVIWGDLWWWTAAEPEPEPGGTFCGRPLGWQADAHSCSDACRHTRRKQVAA